MELNRLSFLNGPHVHVCIFFSRKRQVYVWKAKNLRGKKETKLKKAREGHKNLILVSSGKPDTGKLFTAHLLTPGFVS
ncbi:hypothetical protein NC653_018707 [Populus alba x Populus x berolinensis]|uniref:Uncharacterized protein n=1 Tax=Populus alba x Populus x berolinensis TaxID=444605 RepID=A0AAD6QHB2_9ROSI|nr:hypothetical protein NC653_018707 [Populus alba x Populus x berolinensis]